MQDDAAAGERFISESLARITMTTDTLSAVKNTDLVIEAIVENLDTKRQLFKAIDEVGPCTFSCIVCFMGVVFANLCSILRICRCSAVFSSFS